VSFEFVGEVNCQPVLDMHVILEFHTLCTVLIMAKFIPKIANFCEFGSCKPTFLSNNGEGVGVDVGLRPPSQIL